MKNIIFIAILSLFLLPFSIQAESFDIQPWLKLFREVIAEKDARIKFLQEQCAPTLGPTDTLRKEYALKINDIDKQILNYKIAKEEAQIKIKNNFGHPLVSVWINTVETNDIFTARLEHEKESLKIELNRRLVELGEF